MCATQLGPNQPNSCFTAPAVRARGRQKPSLKRAPWGPIVGPYSNNVTVYPYNACIAGTNPIVRRVMSLTWAQGRVHANQHAPQHAGTQPLDAQISHIRAM